MINILNQLLQQLGGSLTPTIAGALSEGSSSTGDSASDFAQSLFSFMGEQSAGSTSGSLLPETPAETADQSTLTPSGEMPLPDGVLANIQPHMWLHSSVLEKDFVQPQMQSENGVNQDLQVMALFRGSPTEGAQPRMTLNVVDVSGLQQLASPTGEQATQLRLVNSKGNSLLDMKSGGPSLSNPSLNGVQQPNAVPLDEMMQLEELTQTATGRKILQQIVQSENLPEGIDLNKLKAMLQQAETEAGKQAQLTLHSDDSAVRTAKAESTVQHPVLKLLKSQVVEGQQNQTVPAESKVTTEEMSKRATLHELHKNLSAVQKEVQSNPTDASRNNPENGLRLLESQSETANRQSGSGTDQNLNKQAQHGQLNARLNQNPATPMGEGSFDLPAIEHELKEGIASEQVSRISLDVSNRQDIAGRISRVIGQRFMASAGNQMAESLHQHTFMLDDGESLQVSARQSEAGLSLQLGSGNQELMRLIQQHADEIRNHLKNQLNIEIDLQLKQDSGEASSFAGEKGKGEKADSPSSSAEASLSVSNDNHSDTRLNPRLLGFNNNEWVG
jgi:hypothetical protein